MTRPTLALSRCAQPGAGSDRTRLSSLLETSWKWELQKGTVAYDPALSERIEASPFRFHFLPARASRPGAVAASLPPRAGVHLAHAPCPFDAAGFVEEREVARIEVNGRPYHLSANRFPVTPLHFLVIRPADATAESLPQCMHGPDEIEDILAVLREAGAPYRAYFNSNRGVDGSHSGSSVNHWHFQLFRYPPEVHSFFRDGAPSYREATGGESGRAGEDGGIRLGEIRGWPARHVFVEGDFARARKASGTLWEKLRRLNEINVAYNLEVEHRGLDTFRASLFARHYGPELEVPGGGRLNPNFGGWELTGDIVVPTREIFDWVRAHPEEASRVTAERLRQTTRAPP